MFAEFSLFGVAVPAILVLALASFLINRALKRVLAFAGVYRIVWHPALFDAALFVIVLCAVATFSQRVLS